MQAVVYHGPGDIRLDNVPEPRIQEPTDAIVGLTTSAICRRSGPACGTCAPATGS
jgi:threonine dehydrogenase-like Zn-dependent dehydrogenase